MLIKTRLFLGYGFALNNIKMSSQHLVCVWHASERSGTAKCGDKRSVALKRLNGHKYFQHGSMTKGSRSVIFSYAARWRSSGR
jgi:hypothetical protein